MEIKTQEQWRNERLQKAVRLAAEILDMDRQQIAALIESVEDVRGRLVVRWNHTMSRSQVRAFGIAWKRCGEDAENTEHVVSQ